MANIALDKAGGKPGYTHAHPNSFDCPGSIRDCGATRREEAGAQADAKKNIAGHTEVREINIIREVKYG